jgi:hypothetical protein
MAERIRDFYELRTMLESCELQQSAFLAHGFAFSGPYLDVRTELPGGPMSFLWSRGTTEQEETRNAEVFIGVKIVSEAIYEQVVVICDRTSPEERKIEYCKRPSQGWVRVSCCDRRAPGWFEGLLRGNSPSQHHFGVIHEDMKDPLAELSRFADKLMKFGRPAR